MIRINQIKLSIDEKNTELALKKKIKKKLKLKDNNFSFVIRKKSIDARKNEVNFIYSVDVKIPEENKILKMVNDNNIMLTYGKKYEFPKCGSKKLDHNPVVIGSGPAGLFCAYMLAKMGYEPVVLERGEKVDDRIKTTNNFFETGVLNEESNVQFGEGGAGTFSDGKLNTLVKDKFLRNRLVLETFKDNGAKEEILYINKPHLGTDKLCEIVKNMRNEIINMGGKFYFNSKFIDICSKDGSITGIKYIENNEEKYMDCNVLVLAIGHSARDTFSMLNDKKILMESKDFAVGIRIEHPREMIDKSQFGSCYDKLPAADYKLATKLPNGRNVYTFCMCPGGYVVNSSSEKNHLAINGMSYSKRDGKNSNSAIICNVTKKDFSDNLLGGLELQRKLEKKAYEMCNGKIPVQLFFDYKNNISSKCFGEVTPSMKGVYELSNVREIFPEEIAKSIADGIDVFAGKIKDYNRNDALISGVETRTSSPLRIIRDENFESSIKGMYPCGEGAGYAGGITSAAMDGIKVFEAIVKKYAPIRHI